MINFSKCIPHIIAFQLMVSSIGYAQDYRQENIIEVDSLFGLPNKSLPFDQPFILKIPTKSSNIRGMAYLKHVGKKDFGDSYRFREKNTLSRHEKLVNFDKSDLEVKTIGNQKYILLKVKDPYLLDPGSTYTFFWAEDVTPELFGLFDFYDQWHQQQDTTGMGHAQIIYQKIGSEIIKEFNTELNWPNDPESVLKLARIAQTYLDKDLKLPIQYTHLNGLLSNWELYLQSIPDLSRDTRTSNLQKVSQEINKRAPLFDVELREKYLKDPVLTTKRLINLQEKYKVDSASQADLWNGRINLDCDGCKKKPKMDYKGRLANLKLTIQALDEIMLFVKVLKNTGANNLDSSISLISTLKSSLNGSADLLEKIVQVRAQIELAIFNQALSKLTSLGTGTFIYSFETRNKLSITPDFGIVTTRMGDRKNNPYSFVPYMGFHVNFRPINRDIPFKRYTHKLGHYFSGMVGFSLVPISNGPGISQNMKTDSISGFFKDNTALLTGIGYRLGNVLRITGGTMWHFQTTPNTLNVYDSRKIKPWLFLGLSLDLSIKDLLNGITDVFKGAPATYIPPTSNVVPIDQI